MSTQMWRSLDKKESLITNPLDLSHQRCDPVPYHSHHRETVDIRREPTECHYEVNLNADSTDNKGDVLQRQRETPAAFRLFLPTTYAWGRRAARDVTYGRNWNNTLLSQTDNLSETGREIRYLGKGFVRPRLLPGSVLVFVSVIFFPSFSRYYRICWSDWSDLSRAFGNV